MELSRAQEARRRRQQQTAEAEEQLKLVANAVSRCLGWRVGRVAFLLPWLPGRFGVQEPWARGAKKLATWRMQGWRYLAL